jgi:NADH-quinone oxidoreductase subunit M
MLYLYRRVIFGQLTKESLAAIRDLNGREIAVFAPLLVIVFVMGIYPEPFLAVMHVSVENLIERYESALAAAQGAASVAAK